MKKMVVVATCLAALVAVGCGSSSSSSNTSSSSSATTPAPAATTPAPAASSGGGKATKLALAADPSGQLKFDKSSLSAKAGNVTITMSNPSSVPHGIGVTGNGVDKDGPVVNQGGKSSVTVPLKPGKYQFYCPVPGHKQAGMIGTLTVK
jgi:uncharacterized cupredoxin-like copper-binding protein